jgi:hypothetical protein
MRRLEDVIVGVTPSTILQDDFFTGMYNDFKHCYDDSALDAWGYEYPPEEISDTIKSRVLNQVMKHLREKYGDPANTEEFFKDWFSAGKGSETFDQMMSASTFRGMLSWQEQAQGAGSEEEWTDEEDHVLVHGPSSGMRVRPEIANAIEQVNDLRERLLNGTVPHEEIDALMAQMAGNRSPAADTVHGQAVSSDVAHALAKVDDLRERLRSGTMPLMEIDDLMTQVAAANLEDDADIRHA